MGGKKPKESRSSPMQAGSGMSWAGLGIPYTEEGFRQWDEQELLKKELDRLDRREADRVIADLARELDCQPGELAFKLNGLRKKHKDDDAEIFELERNNDDLEAANTDLTEQIERLCQRNVDFGKVEETLAKLKETGPKVVNLQVTMEIGEPEV